MYTVLVVDDKEAFRREVKRMPYFRDEQGRFKVCYEAQNGLEALEILQQNQVDVVLTDIRMPFVDGIELLKRANIQELCTCVILLSEFADFKYAKEGILNGAFDYILKPIDNEKIQESFDRAYSFLSTTRSKADHREPDVASLAEFILSGDHINVMSCANRIAADVLRGGGSAENLFTGFRTVNEELIRLLVEKRPYLELYISSESVLEIGLIRNNQNELVSTFTQSVMGLMEKVNRLAFPSKSEVVRNACEEILSHPHGEFDIQAFSDHLFISSKYLSSLIKKHTGKSLVQYVTFVKVERAKILLLDPEARVGEVALTLGYSDTEYFSKVFKKNVLVSPRDYRRMCNSERA